MVLIDILSTKVVYHLREKGYVIQSITCDWRRRLLKDLFNKPTQMCQFHLVAIVMRELRKKHQSYAGRGLKSIIKTLKTSAKNEFYLKIYEWKKKHHTFLNERSEIPNEKGKYPELNIEKTTNRIEGLFKELKDKLRTHSGLTRKYKILFIQDFFNKKAGKDYQI